MGNDPQVPWSDEQWARANQVVQEESKRARVAATFLPLYGPLDADADFVRRQDISYGMPRSTRGAATADVAGALLDYIAALGLAENPAAIAARERIARDQDILGPPRLGIHDRDTIRLATLQVLVPVRNAQMADPEMASVLSLFRRAANVIARLEDAIVFRGLAQDTTVAGGFAPPCGRHRPAGRLANHGGRKSGGALVAVGPSRVVPSLGKSPRSQGARDRSRGFRRHWPT